MPWDARMIGCSLDHQAIRRAIAARPGGFMLESAAPHPAYGRYSIYGVGRRFGVEGLPSPGGNGEVDPFESLARCVRQVRGPKIDSPVPFVGGWVGYLRYECGQFIEPFKRRHRAMVGPGAPGLAQWWACDTVLLHDHAHGQWWVAACDLPGEAGRPTMGERIAPMARWAEAAGTSGNAAGAACESVGGAQPTAATESVGGAHPTANMTRAAYVRAVERAIEYIRAGDIFQVNFAQRFTAEYRDDPWRLYERLCRHNPAMFAAYLAWDHDERGVARSAILSSSPELFLDLRRDASRGGMHVVTRPIKGTRPRSGDPAADAAARHALETSEKDAAELLMIVDLERNDLGRVCEYGSICVTQAAQTEAHPTVFHRVATVEGDLRGDCDAIDLLRATFPGGSITGAPKVRAMQIIDELEPDPRGPYCGAIGYVGVDGSMMMNLAIRTMCVTQGQVHLWAGGGIVADSDPQAEYEETLAKAEGMRRALAE